MRSFTGGEARQMTEAPISLDAIFREGGGDWRWIWDENFDRSTYFTHGPPPLPSLFALLALAIVIVRIINGRDDVARLMPAGHDCAAITRSSGMTKMSKRKIMVRKWRVGMERVSSKLMGTGQKSVGSGWWIAIEETESLFRLFGSRSILITVIFQGGVELIRLNRRAIIFE